MKSTLRLHSRRNPQMHNGCYNHGRGTAGCIFPKHTAIFSDNTLYMCTMQDRFTASAHGTYTSAKFLQQEPHTGGTVVPHNGTLERERVGRWLRLWSCLPACLNESVTHKTAKKNPQTPPQHAGHTISSGSTRSPLPLWQYYAQLLATMFLAHINTILVH